jgi:hypothetical protein
LVSGNIIVPSIGNHLPQKLAESFDIQVFDICKRTDAYGISGLAAYTRTTEYRLVAGSVLNCVGLRVAFYAEPPFRLLRIIAYAADGLRQNELVLPMRAGSLTDDNSLTVDRQLITENIITYLFHLLEVDNLSNMHLSEVTKTAATDLLIEKQAESYELVILLWGQG